MVRPRFQAGTIYTPPGEPNPDLRVQQVCIRGGGVTIFFILFCDIVNLPLFRKQASQLDRTVVIANASFRHLRNRGPDQSLTISSPNLQRWIRILSCVFQLL